MYQLNEREDFRRGLLLEESNIFGRKQDYSVFISFKGNILLLCVKIQSQFLFCSVNFLGPPHLATFYTVPVNKYLPLNEITTKLNRRKEPDCHVHAHPVQRFLRKKDFKRCVIRKKMVVRHVNWKGIFLGVSRKGKSIIIGKLLYILMKV